VVLRVQHLFEAGESTTYSVPVNIDLNILFPPVYLPINDIEETTLTANLLLSQLNRLKWNTKSSADAPKIQTHIPEDQVITLVPQQIRTFLIS